MEVLSTFKVPRYRSILVLTFFIVQGGRGSRSYQNLEGLAVDLFNNDPTVISVMGSNAFTRESWSEEVRFQLGFVLFNSF